MLVCAAPYSMDFKKWKHSYDSMAPVINQKRRLIMKKNRYWASGKLFWECYFRIFLCVKLKYVLLTKITWRNWQINDYLSALFMFRHYYLKNLPEFFENYFIINNETHNHDTRNTSKLHKYYKITRNSLFLLKESLDGMNWIKSLST